MQFTSERLEFSQIAQCDWALFHRLHTEPEVIDLCFDQPSLKDIEVKFESRLPTWNKASNDWLCLVMREKDTGKSIGVTGFQLTEKGAEIGYLLLPEFHRQGYGAESLNALVKWAFRTLDIGRFEAVVTNGNVGSEKVLAKCGFTLHKIEPDAYCIKGRLYDDLIYLLTLG